MRDSGGGGGCRAKTRGGRTDAEDGNGMVPGPGAGTAVPGSLAKGAPGGTDGFRSTEVCCESGEGRRASKDGWSLSTDERDLSRDRRKVETVDEVGARSNEGRGRILVAFDGSRSVNGDRGDAKGGGLPPRASESGVGRPEGG